MKQIGNKPSADTKTRWEDKFYEIYRSPSAVRHAMFVYFGALSFKSSVDRKSCTPGKEGEACGAIEIQSVEICSNFALLSD